MQLAVGRIVRRSFGIPLKAILASFIFRSAAFTSSIVDSFEKQLSPEQYCTRCLSSQIGWDHGRS